MTDEHLDQLIRDADPYRPGIIAHLDGAEQSLLEEIMSVPIVDHVPAAPRPRSWARRPRVRAAAGALAAVALLAVALTVPPLVRHDADGAGAAPAVSPSAGERPPDRRPVLGGTPIVYSAAVLKAAEDNPRLLIDLPGWKATTVSGFAQKTGSITFTNGPRSLEMTWYPADFYDFYHTDRLAADKPEAVTVDGLPANLFRYSATDFAIMSKPRDGTFVELRTGGSWTRRSFDAVVAHVVRVDVRTWLEALPTEIVTPDRVDARAAEVLADVPLPPGFDIAELRAKGVSDPYKFGVEATRLVGCGWIAEWRRAKEAHDDTALARAADALRSSRRWRVLHEMNKVYGDGGDWPEIFWEGTGNVAAGKPQALFINGIRCT